jgi:primosomal protein N' (replication factor Y)
MQPIYDTGICIVHFYKVIVPFNWSNEYTYRSDVKICLGQIVRVYIGKRHTLGLVIDEGNSINDLVNIKYIDMITSWHLHIYTVQWLRRCSQYTLIPIGALLKNIISAHIENVAPKSPYYLNQVTGEIRPISHILSQISLREFKKQMDKTLVPHELIYNIQESSLLNMRQDQQLAYQKIIMSERICVLQGATGSGKTKVYINLAIEMMQSGQVLIMMPEIALTHEFANRIHNECGIYPMVWNHETHAEAKNAIWHWAINGEKGIVIGSRSALWIPFNNLQCVIIDEEHDISYKQENTPIYHGVHMAILRCYYAHAKCLLVSATPSIETMHNIHNDKYESVSLEKEQRINVIYGKLESKTWLSNELKLHIEQTLARKKQVLLFLNRRGFATKVMCVSCAQYLQCESCSACVVYHADKSVRCPVCQATKLLQKCRECKTNAWRLYGIGIEKIAHELQILFPNARTEIFSADVDRMQDLINDIHTGKIDIIVTTQVLTKGYDFQNIDCVGILQVTDATTTLDPRYHERTLQMLTQVKGRCGRRDQIGTAVIQAEERNKFIEYILRNDITAWVNDELRIRKQFDLPPFSRLIKITIGSSSKDLAYNDINSVYDKLKKECNSADSHHIVIYAPSQAYVFKVMAEFRYYILIKVAKNIDIQTQLLKIMRSIHMHKTCKVKIDVDPYTFD